MAHNIDLKLDGGAEFKTSALTFVRRQLLTPAVATLHTRLTRAETSRFETCIRRRRCRLSICRCSVCRGRRSIERQEVEQGRSYGPCPLPIYSYEVESRTRYRASLPSMLCAAFQSDGSCQAKRWPRLKAMSEYQYQTIRMVCALQYFEATVGLFFRRRALPSSEFYRLHRRQVRMVSTETSLYMLMYKRTFVTSDIGAVSSWKQYQLPHSSCVRSCSTCTQACGERHVQATVEIGFLRYDEVAYPGRTTWDTTQC